MKRNQVRRLYDINDPETEMTPTELMHYADQRCRTCDGSGITGEGDVCRCVVRRWEIAQYDADKAGAR